MCTWVIIQFLTVMDDAAIRAERVPLYSNNICVSQQLTVLVSEECSRFPNDYVHRFLKK
jgi:hypothetical protein